jgi:hypothetical protein
MSPVPGASIVRLTIARDRSFVALIDAAGHEDIVELPIGADAVRPGPSAPPGRPFSTDPPRPHELEAAIEHVENAVMPLARRVIPSVSLHLGGEFARLADSLHTLDDVEARFGALAAASQRGWAAGEEPVDHRDAAALLILREFMHHLSITAVRAG